MFRSWTHSPSPLLIVRPQLSYRLSKYIICVLSYASIASESLPFERINADIFISKNVLIKNGLFTPRRDGYRSLSSSNPIHHQLQCASALNSSSPYLLDVLAEFVKLNMFHARVRGLDNSHSIKPQNHRWLPSTRINLFIRHIGKQVGHRLLD